MPGSLKPSQSHTTQQTNQTPYTPSSRRVLTPNEAQRVRWWLKAIPLGRVERLSEATRTFVDSVRGQFEGDGMLSDDQMRVLETIYDETA